MKSLIRLTLTTLFLTIVGLAGTSQAQSTLVMKVNIPFEFTAGGRTLPAGDYSLVQPLPHFLQLRDMRGRAIAQSFTSGVGPAAASPTAKLRFITAGDRHILSEVWQAGEPEGQQLFRSNREANAERQTITANAEVGQRAGHK